MIPCGMAERKSHRHVPEEHRAQEHLANERTFLAWVRTSVALLSLGFVLARVVPSLNQPAIGHSHSEPIRAVLVGIVLVGLAAVITGLAAWRYDRVNREIESGMVKTDRGMVWFVTVAVLLLSAAVIGFLLVARS